ncbi:hypothetical protein PC9H_009866 [Pleurotus ostreatus]|uniref:Cytochrome P450 n=1 Tax=Pleurotus ostreatus TaxID=5322 RepID=A0A8H6ZQ67_PLEOS|nr:uncharacterized protein PC9H_009866 [Pleurotus ostreatus]KAF7424559.1 hypothetical protein PC9H_009866 [Pleurotus ostreatus]
MIYKRSSRKWPFPLPPGPPADPIIGHLRKVPPAHAEVTYLEWAKKYGEVIYLNLLGRHIIVLNSKEAAYDLLDKRSALYSDRPDMIVWGLLGWSTTLTFLPYGDHFRRHRKLVHSHLMSGACKQYQPMQLENAHLLAGGLLESNSEYEHALTRFSTSIIMRVTYGHQILSDDDEYLALANTIQESASEVGVPGGTPVDLFPILQYLPSWFPGTHYATMARKWRPETEKVHTVPFNSVLHQMAEGTAKPSFLSSMLEKFNGRALSQQERQDLRDVTAIMYGAGAETTTSVLGIFFMAMVVNPECQRLAQEEIDRVVGNERLPTFEDRASLPYIECVVREILRWNPIFPLGIVHRSVQDDIYKGMFIPKGSLVFPNVLAMSLDEDYVDPTTFNPSRFMPKSDGGGGESPFTFAFGFGRRICPGRHLAYASLWIAIATIFSTLHISRKKDKDGHDVELQLEFGSNITNHPKPLPCDISPRSETAMQLVKDAIRNIQAS